MSHPEAPPSTSPGRLHYLGREEWASPLRALLAEVAGVRGADRAALEEVLESLLSVVVVAECDGTYYFVDGDKMDRAVHLKWRFDRVLDR